MGCEAGKACLCLESARLGVWRNVVEWAWKKKRLVGRLVSEKEEKNKEVDGMRDNVLWRS